jgi:hypothetical protein
VKGKPDEITILEVYASTGYVDEKIAGPTGSGKKALPSRLSWADTHPRYAAQPSRMR